MSISEIQGSVVPVRLWSPLQEVESTALDQLRNVASLPWVYKHVAAMPDVHAGYGATVGSVIAMKDAVSPSAVGVDIGCGMAAIKTSLLASDLPDSLKDLRALIEQTIPVGNGPGGSHEDVVRAAKSAYDPLDRAIYDLFAKAPDSIKDNPRCHYTKQLGTLGGGNHFIELCLDAGAVCKSCNGIGTTTELDPAYEMCATCAGVGKTEPRVWLMLHSGSRNAGKTVAEAHLGIAKVLEHNKYLPDRDLAVFLSGTPEMEAYRRDLYWAQQYALLNRAHMLRAYQNALQTYFAPAKKTITFDEPIQCHHNYVAEEVHYGEKVFVTRKGAIRAGVGELGIIPGSMGTRSYIVRGLGNPESFESASHGAGRRMSRSKASKTFTLADLEAQTAGVECRKDSAVIDEIPGAYKDIDQVMQNQQDLVETVAVLKQVLCVKG